MATRGRVLGGPLAAVLFEQIHSWNFLFSIVCRLDILTAALALVVPWPMRRVVVVRRTISAPGLIASWVPGNMK
jgi:MFS transporter, OFA family, oxalate/formate antiporter